jgi:hypothetical protein
LWIDHSAGILVPDRHKAGVEAVSCGAAPGASPIRSSIGRAYDEKGKIFAVLSSF